MKRETLNKQLEEYKLTNKGKRGCSRLVKQSECLKIASSMGITEGIVRNMLKKVYAKTHVGDKGQYFRKFMI